MKEYDVIVIGAGLTGLVAAAAAAKRGKKVMLMAKGTGAVAFGSGTVDLLGYLPDKSIVNDFYSAVAKLPPTHPYARLGTEKVAAAAQFFLDVCKTEGFEYTGSLEKNSFLPTAAGTLKPTGLIPKTMDSSVIAAAERVLVVGFEKLKDYYPQVVAKGLSRIAGYDKQYDMINIDIRQGEPGRDFNALDVARWMDTPDGRSQFVSQLKGAVKPGTVVLVPPVLGSKPSYAVRDELEGALQCKIVELLGMPPGVTGYRLRSLFMNYIKKIGVAVAEQVNITGSIVENAIGRGVVVSTMARERIFYAKSFVLATGGFFGGGLVSGPGTASEPIFKLPLAGDMNQDNWGDLKLFAQNGQPFAQIGIRVDNNLQPVDENGRLILENVFVAGRNLPGYDYCLEKSGNGVAMASGYHAGMSV
ncbi:hypothetical protein P22_0417 [Propionispora sp. 2/2-37]|uniref:anaerobic glycerol-3-phosphate dehydrogenase subunit GlpB n=1 Tax=Propionispora sp. 2/2-37 TaxID=1677858 RepID=UPI0006BB5A2B|nr:anaerobic glycerol-3-phosphate dehydrogenase subunit GlpB [Propionispora sp. 2/2-37]CUH94351.1 hypothetical protein P22_0417 [Propionispora sp. 2/2-37]